MWEVLPTHAKALASIGWRSSMVKRRLIGSESVIKSVVMTRSHFLRCKLTAKPLATHIKELEAETGTKFPTGEPSPVRL